MSFEMICKSCGAVSGPSVGVCPYCKVVFTIMEGGKVDVGLSGIVQLYAEGKLEKALSLMTAAMKQNPRLEEDVPFLLLQAKILFESEGPTSKIKAALIKAYILEPNNSEVAEYSEMMDAKEKLEPGVKNDLGEQALKNLLRRSPKNAHALFLLGTHLFWGDKETAMSAQYLQKCVDIRPNFLRAWECLGTIYKSVGHEELAVRAFRKCIDLETNPQIINYFKSLVSKAAA